MHQVKCVIVLGIYIEMYVQRVHSISKLIHCLPNPQAFPESKEDTRSENTYLPFSRVTGSAKENQQVQLKQ